MNKLELIAEVAAQTNVSKANTAAIVDALVDTIKEAVANGNDVQLVGFGTFKQVSKAARTCRNPKTGETIQVAAKKAPAFKAGSKFKAAVNN